MRPSLFGVLLLDLLACRTAAPRPETGLGHCPSAELEVDNAACGSSVSAQYGLVEAQPLEWGEAAQGALWGGRLVCPTGATAYSTRLGSYGGATSAAPRSSVAKFDETHLDILDRWTVRCAGKDSAVFVTNIYRCGSPCPPRGFRIMDARVRPLTQAVQDALKARRPEDAVARAVEAQRLEPNIEETNTWLGIALFVAERYAEAQAPLEAVAKVNPANWSNLTYLLDCYDATDQPRRFAELLDDMLVRFKDVKEIGGELLCRKARVLQTAGRLVEAESHARQACAAGESRCCP